MPANQFLVIATVFSFYAVTSADAEVFKCSNAVGKIEYSDRACTTGLPGAKVPIAPPPTQMEVYAAKRLANKNASELRAIDPS